MGKARNIVSLENQSSRALKNQRGIGNQAPEMFGGPFNNNPFPSPPRVKHLPIGGGIMHGPIAFKDSKLTIATGAVDVGLTSSGFAGLIVLKAESGTTDTLDTLQNPSFPGQKLILQADTGDTITISTAGNIDTADGSSFSLGAEKMVEVVYSQLSGKWEFVQGGGGGGGGVSLPIEPAVTDNSDTWTGSQTLDLDTGDGHVFKWTVDMDLTFVAAVSNKPSSGTQRTFELEFEHDGVGGTFTVTLPSNFLDENGNTLTSFDILDGKTKILTCRINNGTDFLVIQKNVTAVSGGLFLPLAGGTDLH